MEHSKEICQKMASMLSEYLDEDLSAASCQELIEHMKDCPPCVRFLDSLQKTIELTKMAAVSVAEQPPVPEELRVNLRKYYETFRKKNA